LPLIHNSGGIYHIFFVDITEAITNQLEKRFDLRIIVIGHLAAGKTSLIDRILGHIIDIRNRESTNGIVIRKGGIRVKDGKWLQDWEPRG